MLASEKSIEQVLNEFKEAGNNHYHHHISFHLVLVCQLLTSQLQPPRSMWSL
jgi:hypothetical protein